MGLKIQRLQHREYASKQGYFSGVVSSMVSGSFDSFPTFVGMVFCTFETGPNLFLELIEWSGFFKIIQVCGSG